MSDAQNGSQASVATVSTINNITNNCNYIVGYKLDNSINDGGSWFSLLQSSLQQLQSHAQIWLGGLCKSITQDVPKSIINSDAACSSYFNSLLSVIGDAVGANVQTSQNQPDSLKQALISSGVTENDADSFLDNLSSLNNDLTGLSGQLNNVNTQLDTLAKDFGQDQTNFENVQTAMQQDLNLQQQTISDTQNQVNQLLDKISQGSSDSSPAQVQVDLSQIANNPEAAASIAKFQMMMGPGIELPPNDPNAEEESQAGADERELDEEVYRYANVLILVGSVNGIQQDIGAVNQSMGYVITSMDTVMQKMQPVNSFVSQASGQDDLIMVQVDLQSAQDAWEDLVSYARNLQSAFGSSS